MEYLSWNCSPDFSVPKLMILLRKMLMGSSLREVLCQLSKVACLLFGWQEGKHFCIYIFSVYIPLKWKAA